ncbi:protein draper-like [Ostrea edulis]|uniref:protein draper-like n=1 Tax=Ostrea edulis TaxID=37623 RepID=UPI0024AF23E8|nr:protein draper-like [Ostrea edulis]
MFIRVLNCIIFSLALTYMYIQCDSTPCRSENRLGECCLNFHKAGDGSCQKCPMGTHGVNCSSECPPGYYGLFCLEKCNCSDDKCNSVEGCREYSGTRHNDKGITGTRERSVWENITHILIGSISTAVVVAGLFYLKSRFKRVRKEREMRNTDFPNPGSNNEDEVPEQDHLSGTASTHRTESIYEENQYTDMRLSRMIEIHTEVNISENSLQTLVDELENEARNRRENDSIQTLQTQNEERYTVNRYKEENEYGHFSDSCQYSVLSLRRNIQPDYPIEMNN